MTILPDRQALIKELVKPGSVGAEIGVYRGDFSLELLKLPIKQLHLIDSWKSYEAYALDSLCHTNQDANYTDTLSRLAEPIKQGRVTVTRGFSAHVVKDWAIPLDWIFLDSIHTFPYVIEDLRNWSKHIVPGGVIMMHDHTEREAALAMEFGVVKACRLFCEEAGWSITHHTQEGDWPSCAIQRLQ